MVPALWCTEMVHALLKSERRRRITAEQSALALELLRSLPIVVETMGEAPSFSEMTLARRFALSAYDARYLDVASRYGLPLATRDERLAVAAEAIGLRWHPPEP